MEQPSSAPFSRLHQLDGLRAVACLLVVCAHSLPAAKALSAIGLKYAGAIVAQFTQSGVALFFVLSGVVLLRPYIRGVRPFRARDYFRRRIERLYPPYLVCLFISVPLLSAASAYPTWYSGELLPPFYFGDLVGQLGIISFTKVTYNGAWWSLQVEVLFYLLAPLAVYALSKQRMSWLWILPLTVFLVGLSLITHYGIRNSAQYPSSFQFFSLYSPCFFMGTLISKADMSYFTGCLLLAVGTVWVLLAPAVPLLSLPVGLACFYGGLLVIALQPKHVVKDVLTHPLLIWVGERSYSIFLVHFTAFYMTDYAVSFLVPERTIVYGLLTRAIGLPLALLMAMLIFHWVERRFARGLVSADHFWPTSYIRAQRIPLGATVA